MTHDSGTPGRPALLPHHQRLLDESAISDEIARERGYYSVEKSKELEGMFGPSQRRAPGLVIPIMDVYRETVFYQLRPDEPRVKDGRIQKYETPARVKMALDVLPSTQNHIHDPKVTLWLTEGIRKGDALASIGLRAVTLLGVSSWRGKNHEDGITALPDWEQIAMNGRKMVITFDSDSFQNPNVHRATERFGRWLESRGANLHFVYLPHAEDGSKQGVDDFLAANSREDLLNRIETVWHPLPSSGVREKPRQPQTEEQRAAAPAETAALLHEVGKLLRRFVVVPSNSGYLALSLFVLHTWAFDAAHATPYITVESPEKQSGKTRLLEVLELVVRNPIKVASITAAALFQSVSVGHPTLLIDEADAIFAGDGERNEDLRGVMNAGNMPGSPVIRGGKDGEPKYYDVFGPKVIAGIASGKLPDTIRDRSIISPMDRKLKSERTERLRRRKLKSELDELRDRLHAWAEQNVSALIEYELPEALETISDRLEEAWEPLLAIAELAGGEYPARARTAALYLAGKVEDDDTASHALLLALKGVFGTREVMSSQDIAAALNDDDGLPFGGWNDQAGVTQRELARHLRRYRTREGVHIGPKTIRIGPDTAKGYHREQFESAWERYGSPSAVTSGTTQQPRAKPGFSGPSQSAFPELCDGSENGENARGIRDVADVTAGTPQTVPDTDADIPAKLEQLREEWRRDS
jgi:hypothetical protein